MKTSHFCTAVALALGLAACADNDFPGNDREAELDAPAPAAEWAEATSLSAVEAGLLKPETMTAADLAVVAPGAGSCLFQYTEVGYPVLVYPAGEAGAAVVKLNGKLIRLAAVGARAFGSGPVRVEVGYPDDLPGAEKEPARMILRLEGAPDELGFRGFASCR